jgi:c-di-GMP-binding flagellar brake protein YcgR
MSDKKEARRHARRRAEGMTLTCYRTAPVAVYLPRRNVGEAVLDISEGGCRMRLREHVEIGASITLELRETATGDVFHAHGSVKWIDPPDAGVRATFTAGVEFVDIFTPASKRGKFLLGQAALAAVPAKDATPKPARVAPAPAARFKVDDYVVTLYRAGLLSSVGIRRKNLATAVVDLSRTGAQIAASERLPIGTRVAFTLHLNKFADTFETEAEVIWTKEGREGQAAVVFTGLQFASLAGGKQKLLDYMMSWFTSYQAKYRQEHSRQA